MAHNWAQYKSDMNRFEDQCRNCSCFFENWDEDDKENLATDHECSLEFDTTHNEPCDDFDNCK